MINCWTQFKSTISNSSTPLTHGIRSINKPFMTNLLLIPNKMRESSTKTTLQKRFPCWSKMSLWPSSWVAPSRKHRVASGSKRKIRSGLWCTPRRMLKVFHLLFRRIISQNDSVKSWENAKKSLWSWTRRRRMLISIKLRWMNMSLKLIRQAWQSRTCYGSNLKVRAQIENELNACLFLVFQKLQILS